MLVLSRRVGERIRIHSADGEEIWITVIEIQGGQVRVGFDAPSCFTIDRQEVVARKAAERRDGAA